MSTTSVRFRPGITGATPGPRRPRWGRWERRLIGGALLAIVGWGWIGVDRSVIDDLSSKLTLRERRAFAEEGFNLQRRNLAATSLTATTDTLGVGDGGDAGEAIPAALISQGAEVFEAMGCYACHSIDGADKIGPSLLGLWGTSQPMQDGSSVVMDSDYFRESILYPQALIVEGYTEAAMPSYEGLVSEEDIEALQAYVQSLR